MLQLGKLTQQIVIKRLVQPATIALFLSCSILLCFSIRTLNLPQLEGKYLLDTDSYRFLRQADIIVSEGHLPQIDPMRWQPAGRDLSTHLNLFSYALAYSYRLLRLIQPRLTLYQVALYSSVVCYSLCLLFLYFIWRRIFDPPIAILAVNFSAVFPSLNLHRSVAGFADRDAFCLLLWLGMFLFYLKAADDRQNERVRKRESHDNESRNTYHASRITFHVLRITQLKVSIYAIISGIAAGMLALAWEGCGLATAIIAGWICLRILRERFEPKDALVYSVWYVCFISIALLLTRAYRNVLLPYAFLAIIAPTVALFCVLAFMGLRGKTLWMRAITNNRLVSKSIVSCLLGGFVGMFLLLSLAFLQSTNIWETLRLIWDNFMSPLGRSRLMRTVMELRDLSGPLLVRRYSVVVLVAMAGSVLLVYRFFKSERVNFHLALIGFELILCGMLLSLFVPIQNVSNAIYGVAILSGSMAIFVAYMLPREIKEAIPSNHEKILLALIWLLIMLFSTRGAGRYGFFLDPLLAVLCSFLVIKSLRFVEQAACPFETRWNRNNKLAAPILGMASRTCSTSSISAKLVSVTEFCAIGILVVSELYVGFRLSLWLDLTWWGALGLSALGLLFGSILMFNLVRNSISYLRIFAYLAIILILVLFISSDTFHRGFVNLNAEFVSQTITPLFPKLQDSFVEITNHTDEKSIIAAWWDYGSMLNWFVRRATVVDEDHYIPYWIFMMARHVFAALSKEEALSFLRTHQATHLLITTNDILRLTAITYTGADAKFDRVASIYSLMPVARRYVGISTETTDFILHNFFATDVLELDGEKYPPGHWRIQGVSIAYDKTNNSWKAMVHGGADRKRFSKPPIEFRFGDTQVSYEKDGIPGLVVVFPNQYGKNLQAFYISEVAKHLLAVRLYLFLEEIPGFSLVFGSLTDAKGFRYDANSTARCEKNGLRLWKLNYPEYIQKEDRYLARDFPPTENSLKESFLECRSSASAQCISRD